MDIEDIGGDDILINDLPDHVIKDMIVDSLYVDIELIKMKSLRDFSNFIRILPSWTTDHDTYKYADLR